MSTDIIKSINFDLKKLNVSYSCRSRNTDCGYGKGEQQFSSKEEMLEWLKGFVEGVLGRVYLFLPSCSSKLHYFYQLALWKRYQETGVPPLSIRYSEKECFEKESSIIADMIIEMFETNEKIIKENGCVTIVDEFRTLLVLSPYTSDSELCLTGYCRIDDESLVKNKAKSNNSLVSYLKCLQVANILAKRNKRDIKILL